MLARCHRSVGGSAPDPAAEERCDPEDALGRVDDTGGGGDGGLGDPFKAFHV